MKAKMTKLLAGPLTATTMLVFLCGCAPAMPDDAADASFTASAASQPASVSGQTAENDAPSDTPSTGSTAKDRFERAKEQSGSGSQPTAPAEKPEASQSSQTAEDSTPDRTPSTEFRRVLFRSNRQDPIAASPPHLQRNLLQASPTQYMTSKKFPN